MTLRTVATFATLILLFIPPAHAQAPAGPQPDFRVQVFGSIIADFSARIDSYLTLRATLEQGLPPLIVTDNPAQIREAEKALARRIRRARADARRGDIFTQEIRTEFRRVLRLEMDADTRWVIMDDNPGSFSHRINGDYPRERALSTVPANVLALLPRLPDDIQYRFLGPDLVLHDTRANVILDRLACAIRCDD
jgi:hypothetical protein